ncbi:MAG: hypothetical protein FVQ79_10505 [Planctomycetes bacterium]|nr:hypothetical protein [Planctomycetota bacterium]
MMPSGFWGAIFPSVFTRDAKVIKRFLNEANGKYRKLIIDLRNTRGGSHLYGYENLIRPFLDKPVTYTQIAGLRRKYRESLKNSELKTLRKWVSTKKYHVVNVQEAAPPKGFNGDDWIFYEITRTLTPRNRYNFDGQIFILTDGSVFSATEDYVNTVKRIGQTKLIGRNTGGGASAYLGPPIVQLPVSGMIFRAETEIVINPDGTVNELYGTTPDIELPPTLPPKSHDKTTLLKDKWIQYIIDN